MSVSIGRRSWTKVKKLSSPRRLVLIDYGSHLARGVDRHYSHLRVGRHDNRCGCANEPIPACPLEQFLGLLRDPPRDEVADTGVIEIVYRLDVARPRLGRV